jgi:Domain of unknown function (DUF1883)
MSFLHLREHLDSGDTVVVSCDHQCNVMVMDDSNFSSYRSGRQFRYLGGFFKRFPAQITVPSSGNWNVVLDLGGGSATVRHSIKFLKENSRSVFF